MTNRYPGTCLSCGARVAAGAGHYVGGRVLCASAACHRAASPAGAPAASTRATLSAAGVVTMPYRADALAILRGAPGARWQPQTKTWQWSVSDTDLPRTLECAARLGLEVAPELRARLAQGTAETREADARVTAIEERAGRPLYGFQRAGVDFLTRHQHALLGDDMGLGKTVQTLCALPEGARAIVVCPSSLKLNWAAELHTWRPDLTPVVLRGKKAFRLPEPGEVVIVNYEILPSAPAKGESSPWDLRGCHLVVDEAHRVKSTKAARHKAVRSLGATARAVWFLTGTPLLTRPLDLWGVTCALGGLNPLGGWQSFVRLFGGFQNRFRGWEFGEPREDVPERLRRTMLRRTKAEVLPDLPPKIRSIREVNDLPADLQRDLDLALEEWLGDDEEPSMLPDFRQFSALRARLAEARIPAMAEIVEDYEEQDAPLLVFSAHRAPIDALASREGWRVITGDTSPAERQAIVEAFQAGRLRGVGLTIAAGGVGLTLTRASNVLFVDLDWTPALNLQAEDRVARIGQTASVIQVTTLVSSHPLDRHVQRLIQRKLALIEAAVEREAKIAPAGVALVEETDEAMSARRAAIEAAAERAEREESRGHVHGLLERERERASHAARPSLEVELTAERRAAIRAAITQLREACDGARTQDGFGFSKSDASLGWHLARVLSDDSDDTSYRVAERVCSRYRHTQLGGLSEQIWSSES